MGRDMTPPDALYGALDLGGTKVRSIVADLEGGVYGEDIRPSLTSEGLDAVLARMADSLSVALAASGRQLADLRAVGIASPGAVNVLRGTVSDAPQLPGWTDVPLVEVMAQRLGLPVFLENDASAAALGEHTFGAGRGTLHMLYITMSTGIGGGIIAGGELYRGATGSAGELGHVTLDMNGPLCGCGARGCLEAMASGTVIARRGEAIVRAGESPLLADWREREGHITAEMMKRAAEAGDEASRRVFSETGRYLGVALAAFVDVFNPELILIGGGVARAAEFFLPEARDTMRARAMSEPLKHVRVELAALGDRAGSLGMIAAMRDRV